MDEQRMDVLYKQARNMDSSLIDILDNYKGNTAQLPNDNSERKHIQ